MSGMVGKVKGEVSRVGYIVVEWRGRRVRGRDMTKEGWVDEHCMFHIAGRDGWYCGFRLDSASELTQEGGDQMGMQIQATGSYSSARSSIHSWLRTATIIRK